MVTPPNRKKIEYHPSFNVPYYIYQKINKEGKQIFRRQHKENM